MKFTVERDVLSEAVTWTARTLPQRPPVPVLSGIVIEAADDGALTLSSFDYDVSSRREITADVESGGKVIVSGRLLADISKALPDRPVEFQLEGTKVMLTCGASRFTLLTMPVDEYPALPQMPETSGKISQEEFESAVAQVSIAASRDETLPLLTGVLIEIQGEKITLLATDRYRLAMRELVWQPAQPDIEAQALLRARTLIDVSKSLGSADEAVIALSDAGVAGLIGFESDGRRTTSLLTDGDYPPVRRLFPEETPIHAVVNTAVLTAAVRRVALVAERNTPVKLAFSEGQVVLEAGQGDDAQASEAIEATLVGEPITTAFNPQFLLDGLGAVNTDFVRLSFTQPMKPAVLTGQESLEGEIEDHYRYLLMPIRFGN